MSDGYRPEKFVVRHYRRGDLLDGEAFVLVPERDPAAIVSLEAYIAATPDRELAQHLAGWAKGIRQAEDLHGDLGAAADLVPSQVADLTADVDSGRLSVSAALTRIAEWALARRM